MNEDISSAKIRMLKGSLKCFTYGLLSLLPLLGLPSAVAALWISGRVRVEEKRFWNAARPYRIWGVVCAAAGTIFWCFILIIVIYNMTENDGSSD
jgi:hypothetical protein